MTMPQLNILESGDMEEIITQYARLAGEVGLAGASCYALVRVWQQMIAQADNHRKDSAAQDSIHREEIKLLEQRHREDLIVLNREHRDHVGEIVSRNMDEHRERNRVQTKMAMEVAEAFALSGQKAQDPYPSIDAQGREDPRK